MKILGTALAILGLVVLIYGTIGYDRKTTILDMGGIRATATEHKTIPLAPVIGVLALVGRVGLLRLSSSRRA